MQEDWELSHSFTSDGQGIRCAAVLPPSTGNAYNILTGTQGGGLIEYGIPTGSINIIPYQHDHAITALLADQQGNYITGCKDAMIRIFNNTDHTVRTTLKGHEKPVTSFAWGDKKQQYLISGSWDGTAKIWNINNNSLVATLPDHENSVSVASCSSLSSEQNNILIIATGSAGMAQGNTISGHTTRIWQVNVQTCETKLLHKIANDHEGPIRDICYISDTFIATSSNDGTVKLRDATTGVTQSTLLFASVQHPPMLLSVTATVDNNELAASAEDGHVIVWNIQQSTNPQIIRHAVCVWKVISLPEGDLATCSDDGTLRIFTKSTERMATLEERNVFAKQVQEALDKTRNGPTPDEVAKLPLWERNVEKIGTSEGQVQLFQKNGKAIAAQWSAASHTWIEVGEVTGQADTGMVDGVKYDHVFPIEVDQTGGGVVTLQIGYNNGENPFAAAQRFIDAHMLPQHHLSEIADYITQRVGKQPTMLGMTQQQQSSSINTAVTGTPIASYEYLPMKTYKAFELSGKAAATTLEKMKGKIQEFGEYSNDDIILVHVGTLMETLAASNRYHSTNISDVELSTILKILTSFDDISKTFPALDLARLTVLHPDAASNDRTTYWTNITQRIITLCKNEDGIALDGPAAVAIPMLSIRYFTNALKGGLGSRQAIVLHLETVLECIEKYTKSNNKNIRLSIATLLYNISFYLHQQQQSNSNNALIIAPKMVHILNDIIINKSYETEALYRAMIALGTLLMHSKEAKEIGKTLFLASKVEPAASPHTPQVKAVAKEVYSLLA